LEARELGTILVGVAGAARQTRRRGIEIRITLASDPFLELTFVFCAVEVSFRFRDQPIIIDLPKFVAADSNAFSVC
jgi:hypothetical protein